LDRNNTFSVTYNRVFKQKSRQDMPKNGYFLEKHVKIAAAFFTSRKPTEMLIFVLPTKKRLVVSFWTFFSNFSSTTAN